MSDLEDDQASVDDASVQGQQPRPAESLGLFTTPIRWYEWAAFPIICSVIGGAGSVLLMRALLATGLTVQGWVAFAGAVVLVYLAVPLAVYGYRAFDRISAADTERYARVALTSLMVISVTLIIVGCVSAAFVLIFPGFAASFSLWRWAANVLPPGDLRARRLLHIRRSSFVIMFLGSTLLVALCFLGFIPGMTTERLRSGYIGDAIVWVPIIGAAMLFVVVRRRRLVAST